MTDIAKKLRELADEVDGDIELFVRGGNKFVKFSNVPYPDPAPPIPSWVMIENVNLGIDVPTDCWLKIKLVKV